MARPLEPWLLSVPLVLALCACGGSPEPARTNGHWRLGAPMNVARDGHSATLLRDGRVLVAGGDRGGEPGIGWIGLSSAEIYDPLTGEWTPTRPMSTARTWHVAVALRDGKVLVAGGCTDWLYDPERGTLLCQPTVTAEVFDPGSGTWESTGEMTFPHFGDGALGGALLPDGRVLVTGSWDGDRPPHPTPVSEIYDPSTKGWTTTGDTNVPRLMATLIGLASGHVLAVGGADFETTTELYDPTSGAWSLSGDLPKPMNYAAMVRLGDGRVLVAGGCRTWLTATCDLLTGPNAYLYVPSTEAWSPTGPMSFTRDHSSAVVLPSGKVLVSGGDWVRYEGSTPADYYMAPAGDVYDPATDNWTPTPAMPAYESGWGTSVLLPTGEALHVGGFVVTDWGRPATSATQLFREWGDVEPP